MTDDSPSAWSDFRKPLLGQYRPQTEIEYLEQLGAGLDGVVWRVKISNRIFALKVVSTRLISQNKFPLLKYVYSSGITKPQLVSTIGPFSGVPEYGTPTYDGERT